jgi:hypothetical protein
MAKIGLWRESKNRKLNFLPTNFPKLILSMKYRDQIWGTVWNLPKNSHLRNQMRNFVFLVFIAVVLALGSCSNEPEERCAFVPNTENISVELRWESLENQLPSITTKKELVDFLGSHPTMRDAFFNRSSYPDDSVFINELYHRFTNPHIDTLLEETKNVFGDGTELKKQFQSAFANMKYYYPDFQAPKIQTVISGLETDLFASDTLIIIGLDHYIGQNAKYQLNMYEYMKRRYHKDFIVPSVMLLYGIDAKYNVINPEDRTVLADMVAYGKAYHFAKQMTPCLADSVLIGYSAEEMKGSRENESLIWSRFVEDQVLFSTSGPDKQKYIIERPKTLEVGEKCPGRIGQWVGWQMVSKYSESHPEKSLKDIMSMEDAATLFKQSGYKPQIVKVPGREKM